MKVALILLSALTSTFLCFDRQGAKPAVCRGKPLSIKLLPGPKMSGVLLPLRFGGNRQLPSPYFHSFPSEKPFRMVIRNRAEFNDLWQRLTAPIPSGSWVPPLPEIDFSQEMVIVSAMGLRPTSGYVTVIDGACEADGEVEIFITNLEDTSCLGLFPVVSYPADAVRIPQTKLPVVFREIQISCTEWADLLKRSPRN